MKFPDQGEIFPAANKKFHELVFLVPGFQGNKKKLQPYIELLNDLGFDVFTFKAHDHFSLWDLPITADLGFGLQHRIAEQIENLLNLLNGPKIIFSLAELSAAAIEAISRRQASDVKALICDSGPTEDLLKMTLNLLQKDHRTSLLQKFIRGPAFSLLWNPTFKNTLEENLKKFPNDFKILSIRGWKDKLVSASDLDAVFEPHPHLDWRKLSLPTAGHLQGLKHSASEYRAGLEKFFAEIGKRS